MINTISELFGFLVRRRKYFLIPVAVVIVIVGSMFVLAQGSVMTPFIYALF
jgi:hypothetical protein